MEVEAWGRNLGEMTVIWTKMAATNLERGGVIQGKLDKLAAGR